jgi:GTP cyclohydrolase IA
MQLGARLADRRKEQGRSLKCVAEAAAISTAYLQKLERGEVRAPSPHVLRTVAAALDLPYSEVMSLAGYLDSSGPGVDGARIRRAVREILEAVGEDPDRDGLQHTPARVADMYGEILRGLHDATDRHLAVTFAADHDEMVMVRDIALYSVCEHHLVPFVGKAAVAYIPNEDGRITGLSKLVRLVESYSRRLQVQERLTTQIADEIERSLEPRGVLVVVEAEHLCMSMRGVQKPGTTTVTSAVRGQFRDNPATRAEALQFVHSSR